MPIQFLTEIFLYAKEYGKSNSVTFKNEDAATKYELALRNMLNTNQLRMPNGTLPDSIMTISTPTN